MDAETRDRFGAVDQKLVAMHQRFDAIDQKLEVIDGRFDAIDQRFVGVDHRFDAIDQRFVAADQRFDGMDAKFIGVDRRLESMDQKLDEKFEEAKRYFGVLVERLEGKIDLIAEGYRDIDRRLGEFRAWTEGAIGKLDRRVMRLESRRRRRDSGR